VLVLDEPTVGLDPVLREELWDFFAQRARGGVSVLVSSHVMDEANRCDTLLLMRAGRLLADDTPAAIKRRAGTDDMDRAFLNLIRTGVAR
jgi:ABC-2 type transport system ATP-binding protein